MNEPAVTRLDTFVSSRAAQVMAFGWGFAEATFFFLVPDVFLSLLACRAFCPAIRATLASLLGALLGGAIMYAYGLHAPQTARSTLDHVPGIRPALIASVKAQVNERGLTALMIGPMRGTPYKIYAVDWGARRGSFFFFLLASIPARYVRFLLSVLTASAIARLIEPWTRHRIRAEVTICALFWLCFYGFYFAHFGW